MARPLVRRDDRGQLSLFLGVRAVVLCPMPHDLALDHIVYIFSDVRGEVSYSLKITVAFKVEMIRRRSLATGRWRARIFQASLLDVNTSPPTKSYRALNFMLW